MGLDALAELHGCGSCTGCLSVFVAVSYAILWACVSSMIASVILTQVFRCHIFIGLTWPSQTVILW